MEVVFNVDKFWNCLAECTTMIPCRVVSTRKLGIELWRVVGTFDQITTATAETVQLIKHLLVLLGHIELMKKYYKNVNWSSYDLPKVLKEKGVDDPQKLPGFHYRDDALRLWQAIKDYITRILSIYYHSDDDIQKV